MNHNRDNELESKTCLCSVCKGVVHEDCIQVSFYVSYECVANYLSLRNG